MSEVRRIAWLLFFVSAGSIGFEIFLTRYFALSSWSEYGYWVISVAMVGYAVSGVVLCMWKEWFDRRAPMLLACLPPLLLLLCGLGYTAITHIPFNPLEFQNAFLWQAQLLNIGLYYLALFPFFFVAGLLIGLCFVRFSRDIAMLYMADLVGAGIGGLALYFGMFLLHPFRLLLLVLGLLLLALPFAVVGTARRLRFTAAGIVLTYGVLVGLLPLAVPAVCPYKPLATALAVEGNRILEEQIRPDGDYVTLSSFAERLDIDLSNNYELLGAGGPPDALGLYRDGERIASLPKDASYNLDYLQAALDLLPYQLRPRPKVLLLGARGGFRLREAASLGQASLDVLETDPVLFEHARRAAAALSFDVNAVNAAAPAFLRLHPHAYDIIDVSSEFLNSAHAGGYLPTVEGMAIALQALAPQGLLSFPVGIGEFPVYVHKTVATATEALRQIGITDPARHIIVYRSSWNARLLVSPTPLSSEDIAALRQLCDDRSFDTSYFPGIGKASVEIWNDLPPVSFENEEVSSAGEAQDSLRNDLVSFLEQGDRSASVWTFFDLTPATFDRPFFAGILRLRHLEELLARIDLIPRQEIGSLVNVAVLAQSMLFAACVLFLPLLGRASVRRMPRTALVRGMMYFACLGLGFLGVEMALIERFSFWLESTTTAFSAILSGMLIFSGVGSALSARFMKTPRRGVFRAGLVLLPLCGLFAAGLPLLFNATGLWPFALRLGAALVAIAPLSMAMGMFMPLGLSRFGDIDGSFLPWAWGINGAFSVVATPLASLLALSFGYGWLFAGAAALYLLAIFLMPSDSPEAQA